MSARRAVWRWGWRLLKTDWRKQTYIFALIVVASTLSVAGGLLAIQAVPNDSLTSGTLFSLELEDPAQLESIAAGFGDRAGEIKRGEAELAGALQPVPIRSLDPNHPRTKALIEVLDGRLPSGPSEIAATTEMMVVLAASNGEPVVLDGANLQLVGEVENPTDLNDEFVFFHHANGPAFQTTSQFKTEVDVHELVGTFAGGVSVAESPAPGPILTVLSNVVITFAMVLVGLIVSASFGVIARRRIRQYGLLGAIGAHDKHIRTVAAVNGFILGAIASLIGALLGLAAANALLPFLEQALGHRVGFRAPETIWLTTIVIATVTSTVAAWWPARSIAGLPITEALAARRPKVRPVRHTTGFGLIATAGGFGALGYGSTNFSSLLIILGLLLTVAGVLLFAPATIKILSRITATGKLPARIAARDLGRHQGRAAAALAAVTLALAIPAGISVVSASFDAREEASPPNLPDDTAIVWTPGIERLDEALYVLDTHNAEPTETNLQLIKQRYPTLSVTPIEVLVSEHGFSNENGDRLRGTYQTYTPTDCNAGGDIWGFDGECFRAHAMWVANPQLVELWSLDMDGVSGIIDSTDRNLYAIDGPNDGDQAPQPTPATNALLPNNSSFASNLITEDVTQATLAQHFERITVGWILTSPLPLTVDQVADLRSIAQTTSVIETLTTPQPKTALRLVSAAIGIAVGLAILSATITLIRGEGAADQHILATLGASLGLQRRMAASTAVMLAFAGALLAFPLGFIAIIIARAGDSRLPIAIPYSGIVMLMVVFPLVAAAGAAIFSTKPVEAS